MADAHANFAFSTVAVAPSPATSGTTLTVASGEAMRFPAAPFNATVWPSNAAATPSNAEIVRVTSINGGGSGSILFRAGASTNTGGGGTTSLTIPASVVLNDVMLLHVTYASDGTYSGAPAGWTSIRADASNGASGGLTVRQASYFKVASSSDAGTSVTVTYTGGTYYYTAMSIVAYSGVNTSNPINAHSAAVSTSAGTFITLASVTTTLSNCRVVECVSAADNAGAFAVSVTGPTTVLTSQNSTGSPTAVAASVSDQLAATAGATPAQAATTAGSAVWVGSTVALSPAASGGDALTMLRAQEGTALRAITVGDNIAATITSKTLTDAENFTRATAIASTASLAPGASDSTTTIPLANGYRLYSIATSKPARVRLYDTAAHRTADLSRAQGTAPTSSAGVVLDYATAAAATTYTISPLVDGANLETTPTSAIPMTVTNSDSTTGAVTVTLVFLRTE